MPRILSLPWTRRTLAAATLVATSAATAADVRLIAANAVHAPVQAAIAAFEKASGHKVVPAWSGTEGVTRRVAGGEIFDVVIVAAPNIDNLARDGRLVPGSRIDIARSGVGIAVRAGLPRPDVSSAEAIKRAVLAATSVAWSSGPSGAYVAEMMKKLGVADEIRGRVRQTPTGVQVGDLLARGDADLGFQQVSELLHVKGIDYLGPLPADLQNYTVYAAGLHANAAAPDAARLLMRMLNGPEAAAAVCHAGMEVP